MPSGLLPLRTYQLHPAAAIMDSIVDQRGLSFTVEMSRQAGKNELSAQIETICLTALDPTRLDLQEIIVIKAAPTLRPQAAISLRRLQATLRAAGQPYRMDGANTLKVGDASVTFLSAEPNANVVGHTATVLLEVDEAQEVNTDKFNRDFRPMAAANNATVVFYGTSWEETSLLHVERQRGLELERHDGIERAFIIDWTIPAKVNARYKAYVEAERDRLGPTHPLFTTQYELRPLPGKGRLFSPTQLRQLTGTFTRLIERPRTALIAAGLDIGGSGDAIRDHDRTVLTLGTVTPPSKAEPLPYNHAAVLHHVAWQGVPHDQLLPALIDILTDWHVDALTIDATGLGETTARILTARFGSRVTTAYKFTRPSKSALAFDLLSSVSTGRLKVYPADGTAEGKTFWTEAALCRSELLPGEHMNFYVHEDDGHDDYVVSLALFNEAAQRLESRRATGRTPQPR